MDLQDPMMAQGQAKYDRHELPLLLPDLKAPIVSTWNS
jgi:hypothetical protein